MTSSLRIRPGLVEAFVALVASLAVGYALQRNAAATITLSTVALAVFLITRQTLGPAALGASLPVVLDITGGRLGVHVAPSDVVLAVMLSVLFFDAAAAHLVAAVRVVRPLAPALVPYGLALCILAAVHPGMPTVLNTVQRLELFLVPLLVGAAIALRDVHIRVLRAYVLATTVVAAVWPVASFGMQKNPIGQMIANALLLLIAVRQLRRLAICAPVLVVGLLLTGSRGAVIATLAGALTLVVYNGTRRQRLVVARLLPVAAAAVLAFQFLPDAARTRLTTFETSPTAVGGYSIAIREQYVRTAEDVIRAHPVTGVGVGRYLEGVGTQDASTDPHDVVLLDAAEGGYGLAAALVLLVLGTLAALWRVRRVPLAAAAAAVLAATFAHGLVDVYWVRGTPVLGWLLVGMVCGIAARPVEESR